MGFPGLVALKESMADATFSIIGHIWLAGQDHAGNLDAFVSLGDLLEEGFAEFGPDEFGLIAFVDQIHIDDNHPAAVGIVFLTTVDLDLHLDFFGDYDALLKVHVNLGDFD